MADAAKDGTKKDKGKVEAQKAEKPKQQKQARDAAKPVKETETRKIEAHKKSRVEVNYKEKVVPALMKKFNLKNVMQVPRLDKIVLNMGVGKAVQDSKLMDDAVENLRLITGQQPLITKAKKAISNFKLRQGLSIGCKVTLRSDSMYEFFDRFVSMALPRVRDFRGVSRKSFDGRGNYAMGIKEQIIFHEINRDKITRITGLDVIICTTSPTDEMAFALLEEMGMPFRKS